MVFPNENPDSLEEKFEQLFQNFELPTDVNPRHRDNLRRQMIEVFETGNKVTSEENSCTELPGPSRMNIFFEKICGLKQTLKPVSSYP